MLSHQPSPHYALAYLRVSTQEQALSPEAQSNAIHTYASQHSITLLASFLDRCPSAIPPRERHAFLAMVSQVDAMNAPNRRFLGRRGFEMSVLVSRRDRLARDVVIEALEIRHLKSKRVNVLSVDGVGNGDTPTDELMRTIVGSFAQYERSLIRSRTKAALAVLKSQGRRVGAIPYGYRENATTGLLEPREDEQATIALVHALQASGLGRHRITSELASRGILGRTGNPLQATQIYRLMHASAA